MRCMHCGHEAHSDDRFCVACGVPVRNVRPKEAAGTGGSQRQNNLRQYLLLMVAVLVGVFVIGVVSTLLDHPGGALKESDDPVWAYVSEADAGLESTMTIPYNP